MDRNDEKYFVKDNIKRYFSDPLGEREGNKITFSVEFFSRPVYLLEMFHVQWVCEYSCKHNCSWLCQLVVLLVGRKGVWE